MNLVFPINELEPAVEPDLWIQPATCQREPMRPHHLSFGARYASRQFVGGWRTRMMRSRSHLKRRDKCRGR